jgi:hypothetical protein
LIILEEVRNDSMDDDKEHFDIPPSNIPIAIISFDLFHVSNYGKITEMRQQFIMVNGHSKIRGKDLNVYQNYNHYFF